MTDVERGMLAATIVVSMLLGLAFMLGLGRPWRAPPDLRTMAWLQVAIVSAPLALDLLLLLVVLRMPPPLWLIGLVLLLQDAAYGWRLIILIRAHHHERKRS